MAQRQPSEPLESVLWQPKLAADFPIWKAYPYTLSDADITVLHHHESLELGYCYEGAGIFVIADKVFHFQAGDAVLIHKGCGHLAQSTKGSTSTWRFQYFDVTVLADVFQEAWRDTLAAWQRQGRSLVIKHEAMPKLVRSVRELIEETELYDEHHHAMVRLQLGALIVQALRTLKPQPLEPQICESKIFRRIMPAITHIMAHYSEPIKVADLADLCHLSPTQLRRLFQSATSVAPLDYLIGVRLTQADELLQFTALKIVDIAHMVGFLSLNNFNRAYLHTRHCTPTAFRSQFSAL